MKFEAVLFDWDGCLCDTLSVWLEAYKKTYKAHGVEPADSEIIAHFGDWEGPVKLGVVEQKVFDKDLIEEVEKQMPKAKLHQGVEKGLRRLYENGVQMGIVTSSLRQLLKPIMEERGIENFFMTLIDGEDVTKHKPHSEPILKGMEEMKVEDIVYVGDTDKDVLAARNAKVASAVFFPEINRRFYSENELKNSKPDWFFTEFDKFVDFVLGD